MIILPAFQNVLTVLTVGKDVRDIKIGVVNNELPDWADVCPYSNGGCKSGQMQNLSCRYLSTLPEEVLNLVRQ